METIILSGKEYQNLATRSKVKKNMLFYNGNNEILIYQRQGELHLPTIETKSDNEFLHQVCQRTGISALEDKVEQFLQVINYYLELERKNNKLKKVYLKVIRDYYCCAINLENEWQKTIAPIKRLGEKFEPKIMPLDEAIAILNDKIYNAHLVHSLNHFKQKVKEKKYVREKI